MWKILRENSKKHRRSKLELQGRKKKKYWKKTAPITELVSRGNTVPFSETAFQEKYLNIFTIKQFNFPVPSPATPSPSPPKRPQIVDFLSFLAELPEEI